MKSIFFKTSAIAAMFAALACTSCDRDRYNNVPDTIAGSWTLQQYGSDVNGNNALEAGETKLAVAAGVDGVYAYKGNGTFKVTSTSFGNGTGKWFQRTNNIYTVLGSDTSVASIVSLTSKQMVTLCKDSIKGQWFVYSK